MTWPSPVFLQFERTCNARALLLLMGTCLAGSVRELKPFAVELVVGWNRSLVGGPCPPGSEAHARRRGPAWSSIPSDPDDLDRSFAAIS